MARSMLCEVPSLLSKIRFEMMKIPRFAAAVIYETLIQLGLRRLNGSWPTLVSMPSKEGSPVFPKRSDGGAARLLRSWTNLPVPRSAITLKMQPDYIQAPSSLLCLLQVVNQNQRHH